MGVIIGVRARVSVDVSVCTAAAAICREENSARHTQKSCECTATVHLNDVCTKINGNVDLALFFPHSCAPPSATRE